MAKRKKNIGGGKKRDEWEQKCFYMRVTLLTLSVLAASERTFISHSVYCLWNKKQSWKKLKVDLEWEEVPAHIHKASGHTGKIFTTLKA